MALSNNHSLPDRDLDNPTLNISLAAASDKTTEINDSTADNTATFKQDHTTERITVSFTPEETKKTVTFEVIGEIKPEVDDNLLLNLANAISASLSNDTTVGENIPVVTVKATDPDAAESDLSSHISSDDPGKFTFTRSGATDKKLTVKYTLSGKAIDGIDYDLPGQVKFKAGSATATVAIDPVDDNIDEDTEQLRLTLSRGKKYLIGKSKSAAVEIADSDPFVLPSISISDAIGQEIVNGNAYAHFTVSLSHPSSRRIPVQYILNSLTKGTAVFGEDYKDDDSHSPLVFEPGQTIQTIDIPIIGDSIAEYDENFFVDLYLHPVDPISSMTTIERDLGMGTILTGSHQITYIGDGDADLDISGNNVVWSETDGKIHLYDGKTTTQLTDNDAYKYDLAISGDNVVWLEDYTKIYLYDGSNTKRLTDTNTSKSRLSISGNNVVWREDNSKIYLYDGSTTKQLTDTNTSKSGLDISGNNIVWSGSDDRNQQIYLYDGKTTIQLTDNDAYNDNPQISGNNVVWQSDEKYSLDNSDPEIFFYNGSSTIQLTDSNTYDSTPVISGDNIVWSGTDGNDSEIYLYDGSSTIQLTHNNTDDFSPAIDGNNIVWNNSGEIYLATPII